MMKKTLLIQCALMVLFTFVLLWTVPSAADDAARNVYVCGCGPVANCDKIADRPVSAPCGKPLIEKQVLKEDADKVYVCACPEGCKCGLNQADPTKCSCGKELRAYPKEHKFDCAHGMKPGGGCEKPCATPCPKQPAEAK